MSTSGDGDDLEFFESIPVRLETYIVGEPGGRWAQVRLTPRNYRQMAEHWTRVGDERGLPRCIISGTHLGEGAFDSEEHFVPDGLGFGWTALPRGMGTCDAVNSRFGDYETEWLRFGAMGLVRPWYVPRGKDGEAPTFHAPNRKKEAFTITRDPENRARRVIRFRTETDERGLHEAEGDVTLDFSVQAKDSRSHFVSPAIHKMTFLVLWLTKGLVVFDPIFTPLRRFLDAPGESTYRPYFEVMTGEPTPPGCAFNFRTLFERSEGGLLRAVQVRCAVRVHDLVYGCFLAGIPDDGILPRGAKWREWANPKTVQPETMQVSFKASRVGPATDAGSTEFPWEDEVEPLPPGTPLTQVGMTVERAK